MESDDLKNCKLAFDYFKLYFGELDTLEKRREELQKLLKECEEDNL